MKTSDLVGEALDYWTAISTGFQSENEDLFWRGVDDGPIFYVPAYEGAYDNHPDFFIQQRSWNPSVKWSQCGPLMVKHKVKVVPLADPGGSVAWLAGSSVGESAQVAICRAIVEDSFGYVVPDSKGSRF